MSSKISLKISLCLLLALTCGWVGAGLLPLSPVSIVNSQAVYTVTEGFDSGGKTSYAAADVTFPSGSWNLSDALTGNLTGDARTGNYAIRVRNTGTLSMNFNALSAGQISVQSAVYGSDGSSSWELWESTNNGSSWTRVGATQTAASTSLQTATFTVNYSGAIRFQLRKTAGSSNRIDFDNFKVTTYSVATPTPTPTPTMTPTATPTSSPTPPPSSSEHLVMGNPSNATTNAANPANYLLDKAQYAVSYNRDQGRANWVSWHLDSSWLGSVSRQNDFRADATLPAGWYQVQATDYTNSGYDRGHECPSGDRTNTVANNSATFLMSNMMPQAADNNRITWEGLESYSRDLVGQSNELYIIDGGWGNSGTIANGHVSIPSYTWKVIMVLPAASGNDVSRVNASTRLIAVWIPNQNGINADWRQFRVSVDYIEQQTGFDFFSNVPANIQSQIEASVDNQ